MAILSARLLDRYRGTGADLPFGDPRRSHPGVAMEGYFWRVTDPGTGRVLIALIGVNRGPDGPWATLGLASSGGFLRTAAVEGAQADRDRLGATSPGRFDGSARHLRVDLGPDARVDLALDPVSPWPRRSLGGSSVFQSVPRLNQYWHPWLLAGRATGTATLGDQTWELRDALVYGEKNWGAEGFPDSWWWGQAHAFEGPGGGGSGAGDGYAAGPGRGACVAFAGGQVHARPLGLPLRTEVTALVVRLPGGQVIRLGDPVVSPVTAQVDDETWTLRGRGFGWEVDVDASSPLSAAHVLPVPLPSQGRNTPGALEHLSGYLAVAVRRRGRTVWEAESHLAGLEHGGLARAEAELARRGGPTPV